MFKNASNQEIAIAMKYEAKKRNGEFLNVSKELWLAIAEKIETNANEINCLEAEIKDLKNKKDSAVLVCLELPSNPDPCNPCIYKDRPVKPPCEHCEYGYRPEEERKKRYAKNMIKNAC